jgi:hypothetical protein
MILRLLAFVVAALLVQGVAHAQKGEAAFHCVVKSAYYADRGDQPIPDKHMMWEKTKVDVLIHNGKAFVTHQLFGVTMPVTNEFSILQLGGANNPWRLQWHSPAPLANDPTLVPHGQSSLTFVLGASRTGTTRYDFISTTTPT